MTSPSPHAPSDPTVDHATPVDPAPVEGRRPPKSRTPRSWRGLVLSMLAVSAVVVVLYAIVPRPAAVTQPPVDVTPVAQQAQRVDDLTVWLPDLGEPGRPWKATSARYQPTEAGPTAFYAGYHRTDDDTVFVSVQQIPASTGGDAKAAWIAQAVSGGTEQGTTQVDGRTWRVFATGGDPDRRGFVGELGDMTTVVSGLADDATLTTVTESLRPYQG